MTSGLRQPDPPLALTLALVAARVVEITPASRPRELPIARCAARRAADQLRFPR